MTNDLISQIKLLRQKEQGVIGRLKRLLFMVNHSLNQRKKSYLDLKREFTLLIDNRGETQRDFKVIEWNLVIYQKNIYKIDSLIKQNEKDNIDTKNRYDNLLSGPVTEVIKYAGECPSTDTIKSPQDENAYMFLKLRKQSLMSSLDVIFREYEDEIDKLAQEKNRFIEIKENISKKKEAAQHRKKFLLTALESYGDDIQQSREDLNNRRRELVAIALIYRGILKKMHFSSFLPQKTRPAVLGSSQE